MALFGRVAKALVILGWLVGWSPFSPQFLMSWSFLHLFIQTERIYTFPALYLFHICLNFCLDYSVSILHVFHFLKVKQHVKVCFSLLLGAKMRLGRETRPARGPYRAPTGAYWSLRGRTSQPFQANPSFLNNEWQMLPFLSEVLKKIMSAGTRWFWNKRGKKWAKDWLFSHPLHPGIPLMLL